MHSTTLAWHFNGTQWAAEKVAEGQPYYAIADAHTDNGHSAVVGLGGTFYARDDDSGWTRVNAYDTPSDGCVSTMLEGWAPFSSTRVALNMTTVGTQGRVFGFWNGAQWTATRSPSNANNRLAFGSGDGVTGWLMESYYNSYSRAYYFNGEAWSSSWTSVPMGYYSEVVGLAADDMWAGGIGTILHYDGEQWSSVLHPFSGTTTSVSLLTVSSANLAFARGGYETLIKWDGTFWTVDTRIPAGDIYSIWTVPGADVWLAAEFGVWRYDISADAWAAVPIPAGLAVSSGGQLVGAGDADVSFVATGDRLVTRAGDGSEWTQEQYPTGFFSSWRLGMAAGEMTAFGPGVLRR
ncbi:MAG: hypothetical protein A2341_15120 [Deltaproteobacteria bacterium RIFOXYB12_FULL_58_9]|nr:MAG: hypothetical protein A2341_15120 [Deltaproteobacteria bacterium RIFOXYB12_FULL_58_9]